MNSTPVGTGEPRKDHLAGYYAAITAMDIGIGRILRAIDGMGIRDDTMIIFSSDNGMNMGHHGLWGKGNASFPLNMYDTSVKIPFLVSMPGTIAQGSVCRELASQYDVMPTILDLLGIRNPEAGKLPGRSFSHLLLGKGVEGERGERIFVFDEYGPVRMIRTREWKYVHRCPYGPHELYHLERDPEERDNLYGSADHRVQWESMKAELDAWFVRFVEPSMDGLREGVTGKGQIERCGPAGKGVQAFADDVRLLATREKPV
jgi:arylsulfatase A-like enzyme